MNKSELNQLVQEALVSDEAWRVLIDHLIETRQIDIPRIDPVEDGSPDGTDQWYFDRLMDKRVKHWIVQEFFGPLQRIEAKDIEVGDDISTSFQANTASPAILVQEVLDPDYRRGSIGLKFKTNHVWSRDPKDQVPVRKAPRGWDKAALVRRFAL